MGNDARLEKAIEEIRATYKKACCEDNVTDPVLYALFEVYQKNDRRKRQWLRFGVL